MATVERHRVVDSNPRQALLGRSQNRKNHDKSGSSLNSTASTVSQKSAESKSSGSELLSITDAAVRALEKTQEPKVSCYADRYIGSPLLQDGMHLYSPREVTVLGSSHDLSERLFTPQPSDDEHNIGRLSVGSQNSIRLDTLSQTSDAEEQMSVTHNTSNMSRTSNLSKASSTFLTGQAKPVKVSSKKLKEIRSPFENGSRTSFDGDNMPQDLCETTRSSHSPRDMPNGHPQPETLVQTQISPRVSETDCTKTSKVQEHHPKPSYPTVDGKVIEAPTMTESGYMTQSVKVTTRSEPLTGMDDMGTLRDLPSMTEEAQTDQSIHSQDTQSPIDVVAIENRVSVSDAAFEQSTMSSVAEQSGKGNISHTSDNPVQKDTSCTLESRLSKFQTSGLRQGTLSDGPGAADRQTDGQVHISQCALNDKQKQLKMALVNRSQGHTAVKKHVTPKVLVSGGAERQASQGRGGDKPSDTPAQDTATAAAVAAASAVAATQPFLKAQQDMELRIAQMMDQIKTFGSQQAQTSGDQQVDSKQTQKLDELERQLNSLTQRRLDYLEEMQKQQIQWQAQLLSVSREPAAGKQVLPPGDISQHLTKHKAVHKSVVPDIDLALLHQRAGLEKSVLDTPAPRRHPPTPTSLEDTPQVKTASQLPGHLTPDRKHTKNGAGLLAHILSADDELRGKTSLLETPQSSYLTPNRKDEPHRLVHSPLLRAGDTTHYSKPSLMSDVRAAPVTLPPRDMGPAPLDQYLVKQVAPPSSPYPKLKDDVQPSVPVKSHFSDASSVLQQIVQNRKFLESNMESVMRTRQECDIYSMLEQVNRNSSMPERVRIQKMVDDYIKDMNHSMEREVMEELLKVQEQKKNTENFMIPERDTTVPVEKPKVVAGRQVGSKVRGRAEARIDSGIRKPRMDGSGDASRLKEKENVPSKKPKNTRGSKLLDSSTYRSRVYGKSAAYSPQRATQKEPYLRFRSTSPKAQAKPRGHPLEVKGVVMSSAKTQAGSGHLPPTDHTRTRSPVTRAPVPPPMVAMAIPLGAPRKDGGLTTGISFPSRPSPGPVTSTPLVQSPSVGVLTRRDPHLDNSDMYLDLSANKPDKPEQSASDDEDDDQTITEEDSAPIDIPGYRQQESTYHGPRFPPQAPALTGAPPTSHQLAADIRRRDILQDQALDWVEQELMARVLSDFYANQTKNEPAPSLVARVTRTHDDTESDYSDSSSLNPLVAEGLGQDGLQLFVDAGQPVDDKLVNALLKEVIAEKIAATVGSRTSKDDEKSKPQETGTTPKPSPRRQKQQHFDSPVQIPTEQVSTPQPTPRHTPPTSPPGHRGTPAVTPDHSPPVSARSEPPPAQPSTQPPAPAGLEREDSVRTDSEEESLRYRRIMDAHAVTPMTPVGESTRLPDYEVSTPDLTPRMSLALDQVRTPSPSEITDIPDAPPTPPAAEPEPVLDKVDDVEPVREAAAGPETPITFSVGIQAEEEDEEEAPPAAPSPVPESPPLQERQPSETSVDSSLTTSITSETFNENLSEGQWLLTLQSEGEVPGFHPDTELRERIKQHLLGDKSGRRKDDDTFLDADEIDADQDISELPSEGEFLHVPEMIQSHREVLGPLQGWPLSQPQGWPLSQPQGWPVAQSPGLAMGVDASLGEVTFGQKSQPPLQQQKQDNYLSQPPNKKGSNNVKRPRGLLDDHRASLDGIHEHDEPDDSVDGPSQNTQRPVSSAPPPIPSSSAPVRGQARPVMATVMAGGREPSRRSGPGGRSRSIPLSRSLSPDLLSGRERQQDLRLTQTSGQNNRPRLSQTSLHSTSEFDTQTPDQMNIETLLQSRDYLATSQSDLGTTTAGDFDGGLSDRLGRSAMQSYDFGSTTEGHYLRQTMGSTSDMSLSPGLTQTLERSSEEVAQDNRLSYTADSDLQDLRAASRPRNSDGRHEPLQVSVTIPSMGEESSGSQESYEDVSELSLGGA